MALVETLGITLRGIQNEIDNGYVTCQSHPTLPLKIYNYTLKTQIENNWNEVTKWCRGLILDNHGEIVAQPMKKFFNFGEPNSEVYTPSRAAELTISLGRPSIYEKLDGSLGILWRYTNPADLVTDYGIATRGSFTSAQAIWATDWLKRHIAALRSRNRYFEFYQGWTLMFEIIYPANRIVCKYDWAGLILIAATRIGYLGAEMRSSDLRGAGEYNFLRVANKTNKTLEQCVAEDTPNKEGYVAVWHRGSSYSTIRCKIKHPTYVRLHKIITGCNPKVLWQMFADNANFEQLLGRDMPQHFKEFVNGWCRKFRRDYDDIENRAKRAFSMFGGTWEQRTTTATERRKQFAQHALTEENKELSNILFAMYDGKDYRPIILDMIKPKGNDILNREEAA